MVKKDKFSLYNALNDLSRHTDAHSKSFNTWEQENVLVSWWVRSVQNLDGQEYLGDHHGHLNWSPQLLPAPTPLADAALLLHQPHEQP